MANEATLIMEFLPALNMTCADGTGIEQGAILKLSDPMTAAISDGDVDAVAGILKTEKIANDGKTFCAVYRSGIFDIYASGSITAGDAVVTDSSTSGANIVKKADTNEEHILGTALEDHSGAATQIRVELKPFGVSLA